MVEISNDTFVDLTIGVSAGHVPPYPSSVTLAWPIVVWVPNE